VALTQKGKGYQYILTVTGPHILQASVSSTPQHTLTVTKTGTGKGTVSSTPAGITCGGTCSHGFDEGTLVSLAAAADSGSTFSGWSGGGARAQEPARSL